MRLCPVPSLQPLHSCSFRQASKSVQNEAILLPRQRGVGRVLVTVARSKLWIQIEISKNCEVFIRRCLLLLLLFDDYRLLARTGRCRRRLLQRSLFRSAFARKRNTHVRFKYKAKLSQHSNLSAHFEWTLSWFSFFFLLFYSNSTIGLN